MNPSSVLFLQDLARHYNWLKLWDTATCAEVDAYVRCADLPSPADDLPCYLRSHALPGRPNAAADGNRDLDE